MSLSHRLVRRVLVLLMLGASLVVGAAHGPAKATTVPLPDGFGAIAVDDLTGRVFVSSPTGNVVSVFGGDGTPLAALSVPGAGSMLARHGLVYVAATTAGRIDVFDATSLQQRPSLGTGLDQPGPLTWAAGELWTTTGRCGTAGLRLASVDVTTGSSRVHPRISLSHCPGLVGSPTEPNVVVGYEQGVSPTTYYRLDVSSGVPVIAASFRSDHANTKEVTFLADGDRVLAASGSPYVIVELRVADLKPTGVQYQTGHYPNAVAVSGVAEAVAAGRMGFYTPDVDVFHVGGFAPVLTHDFGSTSDLLMDRGLAWSPDGHTLYAVSGDLWDTTVRLTLFTVGPVATATTTTLTASRSEAHWADDVRLTAAVSGADGGTPTGTVTFFDGTQVLGRAPLVGGVATLDIRDLAVGTLRVVAVSSGDAWYFGSRSEAVVVTVAPATTETGLTGTPLHPSGDVRVDYGARGALVARVTLRESGESAPSGEVVFRDAAGVIAVVPVVDGLAELPTDRFDAGTHDVTAEYQAHASASGSTSSAVRVRVSRTDSVVSVTSSPARSLPGEEVVLTAVVARPSTASAFATGTVVFHDGDCLLGAVTGSEAQCVLGSATLASGVAQLSVRFVQPGTHAVVATYNGDARYRPGRSDAWAHAVAPL